MIFAATILTPINTLAAAPKKTVKILTKGIVYRIEVFYPPGPSGLVGARIRHSDVQLYPRERDEWFLGDNITISFEDTYFLSQPPWEWEIHTYNLDTAFEHTIQVRIGLMTEAEYTAKFAPTSEMEQIQSALDQLAAATENQYRPTGENPLGVFEEQISGEGA